VAGQETAHRYLGAATCKQCHEQPGELAHPHVKLTEFQTWADHDFHARAYAVLEQPRSRQMAELLWGPGSNAHDRAECLSCHSVTWPKELRGPSVKANEGVSCEACHGPSSDWLGEHQLSEWYDPAQTPPEKKVARGMFPTWDADKLAARCLSCHLGNVAEGKLLKHEFYAAGHPPLPSFELVTFRDAMPPHWKPRQTKDGEVPDLRAIIAGAAATVGESMRLLEMSAQSDSLADFANFDCAACHHELERPSWRVARGYSGRPGRLRPRAWPTALLGLGAVQTASGDDRKKMGSWSDQLAALQQTFETRVFGDPAAVVSAARDLVDSSDRLRGSLRSARYDRRAAVAALNDLARRATRESLDYDSARQIAWAFDRIYSGLDPKPDRPAELDAILAELRGHVAIELPSVRRDKTIVDALPRQLSAASNYSSNRFKSQFEEILRLLQ
jgi:hypothetical protein